MSGIKTGNKGFVNPVDGKVYSVDPGVGSVNTVGKVYDPGDMTVDQGVKDISKPTRITLGTYLSNATKGLVGSTIVSNKYTIDSSTDASLAATLVDATGYPMPVSPTTNSSKFAGSLPSSFSDDFSAFQGGAGDNKIKKGLSATPGKDGNELLAETSIVNTTVVSAYQTFAFIPNYRAPGDVFTTVDITSPPRLFDPTLVKQGLLKVLPNAEAIVVGDLVLKLADIVGTPATLTAAAKNAYPVSIPVPANFILTSTTTEGYPSPLTTSGNQNATVFAAIIPPSVSDNYIKASNKVGVGDNAVTTVIGKGKSLETTTKKLLDGNELLPGVGKDAKNIVTLQPALAAYTVAATGLNYRVPGTNFTTEDILSPSSGFDPAKVKYASLSLKKPNEEAVIKADLALKLIDIVKTPMTLTMAPTNAYPVVVPETVTYASITTIGYPSPIKTPSAINTNIFTLTPGSSVSKNYIIAKEFKAGEILSKGKSVDAAVNGISSGNNLLSEITILNGSIDSNKSPSLYFYSAAATSPNYRVPGSVFTTDDITEAPASFDPKLVKYASLTKVMPNVEAVRRAQDLVLKLADIVGTPATLTAAAKNAYPVSIPIPAKFILASTTTEGYPSPLTTPTNQNAVVFATDIQPSVSDNYKKASNTVGIGVAAVTTVIGKGKSLETATKRLLDGNELLSNKTITTIGGVTYLNDPILKYTKAVIEHNIFKPSIRNILTSNPFLDSSINASSPPPGFEPEINDIDSAEKKGKYTDAKKYSVTLANLRILASDITAKNEYPIKTPKMFEFVGEFLSPITTDGVPTPFGEDNNQKSFVSRDQIKPNSKDPSLANTSFGKGKVNENSKNYDGHNLLSTVGGNHNVVDQRFTNAPDESFGTTTSDKTIDDHPLKGKQSPIDLEPTNPVPYNKPQTSAILEDGNSRWVPIGGVTPGFNKKLRIPRKDASGGFIEVSHLKMAKVGTGLLQRAAGEIPAIMGAPFNPTGGPAEAAAMAPSVVQLGVKKIANKQLTANDVLDSLAGEDESVDSLLNTARGFLGGDQSWGAANSSTEPYDEGGLSSVGTTLTLIALLFAIILLFSGIQLLFSDSVDSKRKSRHTPPNDFFGQYTKGKYLYEPIDDPLFSLMPSWWEVFGIRKTKNSYNKTLVSGMFAFFIGSRTSPATTFAEFLKVILSSAVDSAFGENSIINANVIVCRTIIRSALVFAIAIDSMIRKFQQNPMAGSKAALDLLRVWRSSKLIASMNVFSAIGDTLLDSQFNKKTVIDRDGAPLYLLNADSLPPETFEQKWSAAAAPAAAATSPSNQATVQKSKLSPDDRTLAWSSQRAPSMYLLPNKIIGLQTVINGPISPPITEKSMLRLVLTDNLRISKNDREQFERMLDAEYVPFSFQDVRTNEIISFHAFLSTLSDDYSASYESVEGFGRVEPVKIYKSTTRKIGMSFHIVSTSPQDFDQMWYKINKLLTFVYPQYTHGRDLISSTDNNTYQFKAPFSQQPGASPLVRIRLGDLIMSNYSKFALARLFGLGDGNMKIPTGKDTSAGVEIDFTTTTTTRNQEAAAIARDAAALALRKERITALKKARQAISAELGPDPELDVEFGVQEGQSYQTARGDDSTQIVTAKAPAPSRTSIAPETQSVSLAAPDKTSSAIAAFMNPENNAIVKSFESAAGKGLAGFIESMNFDWYSQTTWDTDPGKTAPKMCKVTITFSPIHDITPGIDHTGYNRAPVYPVGAYSRDEF